MVVVMSTLLLCERTSAFPASIYQWRIKSKVAEKYIKIQDNEVRANGEFKEGTMFVLEPSSPGLQFLKVHGQEMYLSLDPTYSKLHAVESDKMSTVFKLMQQQDDPDTIQLLANVTLTVPCAELGEEADTDDTTSTKNLQTEDQEGKSCKVIEECAIAFNEEGNFVRCQDQEENDPRADLSFSYVPLFFPFG